MFIVTSIYPMYIFIFLHQTTTPLCIHLILTGCISLYSYIKPQLEGLEPLVHWVVYLYIPTSNHNIVFSVSPRKLVVYLYIPTSNHNVTKNAFFLVIVVYLYIPTSNHNGLAYSVCALGVVYLYIPTSNHNYKAWYDTYAPLYIFIFLHQTTTSIFKQYFVPTLYIFIFLHQTTTHSDGHNFDNRCISLYSYIKPQLAVRKRYRV